MKKVILLSILVLLTLQFVAKAQLLTPFATKDSININKINALALVHGDMWWNPATELAHCYFPATGVKSINFASALWMSGYDAAGKLHIAAQTYRQNGNDYWPGPLDNSDTLTYATSQSWAKIWKVNRTDIVSFVALSTHDSASTPEAILTWPAVGNSYARGNAGAPLTFTPGYAYAPFVDLNGDGLYEPLQGEYPDVKGDQALWWVFSDNGPTHTETKGRPLGVEVHVMAYAYNRGTLIDNVVYYDYNIINRSGNTYTNFRVGLWDDVDLGYYNDDYIGFDSVHRMGIDYNGTSDDGLAGGHPANSYDTMIPIVGVTMITLPGDNSTTGTRVPAGSFMYYNNDNSAYGNPAADTEYNNYLRGKFRTGVPLHDDFTGGGAGSTGTGAGPVCNYVFPGDPAVGTEWSECVSNNTPGDRRFIITSNDFTLLPGAYDDVLMALVATDPDTANGCPKAGFTGIKTVADTAWHNYTNPPTPLAAASPAALHSINIYPNPAHDKLYIDNAGSTTAPETILIYNTIGQVMNVAIQKNSNGLTADISHFPAGMYYIVYSQGNNQKTAKFVKQ